MNSTSDFSDLSKIILQLAKERKPQTVKQLVILVQEEVLIPEKEIVDAILELQNQGKIKLEKSPPQSQTLRLFLKTSEAIWYWATIVAGVVTALFVLTIPENLYPWIYVRNVLGIIFVLFLPGYALMKALFPGKMANRTSPGNLEIIERFSLSIGLSIALVPAVGLLLYYSPWGLNLVPVVLSLLALTLIFATVAVVRENRAHQRP
jgi:hypothetical protein